MRNCLSTVCHVVLGHSKLECDKPVIRNDQGKLPYDLRLQAPEIKKKKVLSFLEAAVDSYGSGTFAGSKQSRSSTQCSGESRSFDAKKGAEQEDGDEVLSPLKERVPEKGGSAPAANTCRTLFQSQKTDGGSKVKKQKAKGTEAPLPPDLNLSAVDTSALVPHGLVTVRVQQIANYGDGGTGSGPDELPKKQRRALSQQKCRIGGGCGKQPPPGTMKMMSLNCSRGP